MTSITEFLEKDIITFLDIEAAKFVKKKPSLYTDQEAIFGLRDYEKELGAALEGNDFNKAKLIFKDSKKEYSKTARNSPKKESLDIIVDKLKKVLEQFAVQHNLNVEDEIDKLISKGMEKRISQDLQNVPAPQPTPPPVQQPVQQQTNIPVQIQQPQQTQIAFDSSLNTPIGLDKLKDKQQREKALLDFKQHLELESEKSYNHIKKEQEGDQKKLFKELKEELKTQYKQEFEKLEKTLSKKFGDKYIDVINKIEEYSKTPKKEIKPTVPKEEWTNKDDFIILEIVDKQMNLLKKLLKQKDYVQAKIVFNTVKIQTIKLKHYKKHKQKIYYVLKKIGEFLEKHGSKPLNVNVPVKKTEKVVEEVESKELKEIEEEIVEAPKVSKEEFDKLNDDYLKAVSALKLKNKPLALKLFVDLARNNPANKAIKIRLKEALAL